LTARRRAAHFPETGIFHFRGFFGKRAQSPLPDARAAKRRENEPTGMYFCEKYIRVPFYARPGIKNFMRMPVFFRKNT
jgi:hypothetical protein